MITYLITGGAGSLGTAIINEIQKDSESKIRVLDNNEHALANLKAPYPSLVRKLYGNIIDKERVLRAMRGVDVVIHCAAMKNLEITEFNPTELIKTNVIGTDIILSSAVELEIPKVIFISSDKAVSPVSIYGASKLIGEHTALNYNKTNKTTKISIFRSGNFTFSNGNVFEVWEKQFKETGKINVTDMNCSRYYITTEDAAKAILNALNIMQGGEIFIPNEDIMRIKTMRMLINTFLVTSTVGFISVTDFCDNNINIIGLRPGEKVDEQLYTDNETINKMNRYYEHLIVVK